MTLLEESMVHNTEHLDAINEMPLVSVIVPCYNHSLHIRQCIESIINQTYKNIELIVIDDGSTDNSVDILQELSYKYHFLFFTQKNQGISETLNRGIREYAKGDYLAVCASDDYWEARKIEIQLGFMQQNQFFPMVFGKTYCVDEQSKRMLEMERIQNRKLRNINFDDLFPLSIHPPVNYMYRMQIFKEIGLFDPKCVAEDYDMNLRIASKYGIGYIDQYLGYYRINEPAQKMIRYEKVVKSCLYSMERFRHHTRYKYARVSMYLTLYDTYSGFTDLKIKALKYSWKCLALFYKKRFIIASIKLLLQWKKNG